MKTIVKPGGKTFEHDGVLYSETIDFATAPFPVDEQQVAILVDYKNEMGIADDVSPRIRTAKQEFKYRSFSKQDGLTIPDTTATRKGALNQLEFGGTETTDQTKDYGLMAIVPRDDIDNAPANYNPVNHHTQKIAELIALDREKRVATQVFTAGNYNSSNKKTLDGSTNKKWSDYTDGDPMADILLALDACVMRPNKIVMGQEVWTYLRRHPKLVSALNASGSSYGMLSKQAFMDLFELELLVGASWNQTANKGQSSKTYARLWGNYAALVYSAPAPSTGLTTSMFFTAQWGDPIAFNYPVLGGTFGLTGGQAVVAGERVKEVVTADDLGYLFTSPIS